MKPTDLIYNTVYKKCKGQGCDEASSKDAAIIACDDFKKNKFTTPLKLIDQAVTAAKKLSKKVKR